MFDSTQAGKVGDALLDLIALECDSVGTNAVKSNKVRCLKQRISRLENEIEELTPDKELTVDKVNRALKVVQEFNHLDTSAAFAIARAGCIDIPDDWEFTSLSNSDLLRTDYEEEG